MTPKQNPLPGSKSKLINFLVLFLIYASPMAFSALQELLGIGDGG